MSTTLIPVAQACYEFQGCEFLGIWCKGHVAPEVFVAAVTRSYGEDYRIIDATKIEWQHQRSVPDRESGCTLLHKANPGRGAYAVTWLDAKHIQRIAS